MATMFQVKCNSCNDEFSYTSGHFFYSTIYRCEQCGKRKKIEHDRRAYMVHLKPSDIGQCPECNGTMSENAKMRCPKCKSTDVTVDEDNVACID